MSLFRRRSTSDTDAASDQPTTDGYGDGDPTEAASTSGTEKPGTTQTLPSVADRSEGPFDSTEVDGPDGRLDLGALWLAGAEGLELRLELEPEQQQVIAVTGVLGESAVQLQAFASPKSGGLWDEIREEIAQSIVKQGGTAQVKNGVLGTELATRMPSAGPDGQTVFAPARFTGVDGPRWFLRAVFSGRAAIDDAAAGPLLDLVRSAVVVRGSQPMAPRELLPLTVPSSGEDAPAADDDEQATPDLNPFERGPEITEVR
ncbi:MAG: DUF3710 domain-containing protein [Nostocoides sp.]